MKGVIMAGGEGSRLRPLTSGIPKPMVPIMNKPVMEHIINLLKKYNVNDIAVTMCYLPDVITDYFGSGESFGVDLKYYIEEIPLGTGGSVLNAKDFLDETFIVVSGDALTDIDLKKAVKMHKDKGAKATLVLKQESIPLEYGMVIIDENQRIVRFLEKPGWGEVFSDTINTGIYILEPEVLDYYNKGDNFDFSKDLFPRLLKDNIPMFGYVAEGYWNDIGDLNAYKQTHLDILDKKVAVINEGDEVFPGVIVCKDTYLPENIRITPPVFIGRNCTIKNQVFLDAYTVLGDNCEIGENSNIARSIIWSKSHIGNSNECRGTILCNKVNTLSNVNIFEESVIGHQCSIGSGATIKPNVKIWPNKNINENAVINRNLVWGIRTTRSLFGNKGISGEVNVDITPELASLLGSAFGSQSNKDNATIVSSDGSKASALIRECLAAGILMAGSRVISIDNAITPINRFAVRFYRAEGGIHVSQDFFNRNLIKIEIFNKFGGDIDRKLEKKIETLFLREDFERGNIDIIGDIIRMENFTSFYLQSNMTMIENLVEVKKTNFNVIITSPSSEEVSIVITYLKLLGCNVEVIYPSGKLNNINQYVSFLSQTIKTRSFNLGVVLNGTGEELILIDEKGNVLNKEKFTLLAAYVSLKSGVCTKVIVPNTVTNKVEEMAKEYGAEVLRTKSSVSDTINELLDSTTPSGERMLQYQLYFDVVAALGRIISFLVKTNENISMIIKELPDFHMRKVELSCEFQDRGRVVNELIKQNSNRSIDLLDGIRINTQTGWALVLPDSNKPVFNIFSEGSTEEYAEEISLNISEDVKKIIMSKNKE
ncbi:MAG: NTP transferase domain-containing protein [Clostridiaceae bacterium]|nr:NTP transferase domain-containing protein [Clostridiaceae bacterium]